MARKPALGKYRLSEAEYHALAFPEPEPPLEFVKKIRLDPTRNVRDEIDLSLTPYLRRPVECLGDFSVEVLGVMGCRQSGKTIVPQVCIAHAIDQDPGPMAYIGPDEDTIKKIADEKIISMIDSTPCLLRHRYGRLDNVSREGVKLDTMVIHLGWSNSATKMNALPKMRVIFDEVRLFKKTLGHESNAVKQGMDMLTTYYAIGKGQAVLVSTPSVAGDLLHEQLIVPGTVVLFWCVPCPECGKFQKLDFFQNLKKPEGAAPARCVCRFCGGLFPDQDHKRSWNGRGVWAPASVETYGLDIADIDESGQVLTDKPLTGKRIVFAGIDCMVSPFRTWERIWREYENTKDNVADFKNFWQCWLSRFWEERESKSNAKVILARKEEGYSVGQVPDGVKVITCGLDTQDYGLYFTFWGFGGQAGQDMWLLDDGFIQCGIDAVTQEELEDMVRTQIMARALVNTGTGEVWYAALTSWDSGGHRTKEVYSAVRRLPRCIAIKGHNGQNRTIVYSKQDTHYNIRTVEFEEQADALSVTQHFHLPKDCSDDFIKQFSNRVKDKKPRRTGKEVTEWLTLGPDHLRDCTSYAMACLHIPIQGIGLLKTRIKEPDFKMNPSGFRQRGTPAPASGPEENPRAPRAARDDEFYNRRPPAGRERNTRGGWTRGGNWF